LDRTNAYAEGIYATIHDDDQPLGEATRGRVAIVLEQVSSNLRLIESIKADLVEPFIDELAELVRAVASATKEAVEFVAAAAEKIVSTVIPRWLWWALGGVGVAVGGYFLWKATK